VRFWWASRSPSAGPRAAAPILAAILTMAATQATVMDGMRLSEVYSLGLAVPLVAASLAIDRFFQAFARIRRHYRTIQAISGLLLVAIGILVFTSRLSFIAQYLTPYLPTF
jgi:cytochrome c-type biogenesis protein